jgi:hypothetical protein
LQARGFHSLHPRLARPPRAGERAPAVRARIVAELAKATLQPSPKVDWDGWVADYSRVRGAIEATYPDMFKDFNKRMFQPGGFPRPLAARERKWNTKTGRANLLYRRT